MQKQIISLLEIIIRTLNYDLMCFDVNNLYGWAMFQKLPVDGFK